MRAESVKLAVEALKEAGVSIAVYLPDSYLKELYEAVVKDPDIRSVCVTNEGEGVAICGGVFASGKRAVMIMENSGIRVAAEPLARMGLGHGVPVVMIMSYRGDIGEKNWWGVPHGITMEPILQALRIPYRVVRRDGEIKEAILDAFHHAYSSYYHTAVVMAGSVVR
ncbi:MAG: sulfopyruvate decarboxylase [Candidatus Tectomicrobia bacterium]|nr:sulfopyruvate decarboxylase [Candidatus Tectomicrobia bacterium]